jgi:hypothetical protein
MQYIVFIGRYKGLIHMQYIDYVSAAILAAREEWT